MGSTALGASVSAKGPMEKPGAILTARWLLQVPKAARSLNRLCFFWQGIVLGPLSNNSSLQGGWGPSIPELAGGGPG